MKFDELACENLINSIYAQAAEDYVDALLKYDEKEKKETKEFLESGAYFRNPNYGKWIINHLEKELKDEISFCAKFLNENTQKTFIDEREHVVDILQKVILRLYRGKLSLRFSRNKHKFYLRRKTDKKQLVL